MTVKLSEEIELTVDAAGVVLAVAVDGVDISGWIAGTRVMVVSDFEGETMVQLALTAPVIRYTLRE